MNQNSQSYSWPLTYWFATKHPQKGASPPILRSARMKPYRFYSFEFSCWGIDMRFTRTLFIHGFLSILVACGGGSSERGTTDNRPPSPGPAANETVVGVDTNANSVRDEVEIQLLDEFKNDPPALKAAMQSALAYQHVLTVDVNDPSAAVASLDESARAALCMLNHLSDDFSKASAIAGRTYILTYNTPDRIAQRKAVITAAGVHGRSIDSTSPDC